MKLPLITGYLDHFTAGYENLEESLSFIITVMNSLIYVFYP